VSMPPGQPRRPSTPPSRSTKPRRRGWLRRHPIWSTLIAIFALLVVIISATTNGTGSTKASSATADPSPPPTSTPTASKPSLICDAQAVRKRPADNTVVKIRVHTVAHAQVTTIGPLTLLPGENAAGLANANGNRALRFRVGDAPPGLAVVITVDVSRSGSQGSCQATLLPRPAPATAVAAPTPASPPSPAPAPPPATAASCYPLSDEGTCYEPGEFCRDDDHGVTGVAGDGETIICEDNDGWRWEPA
jgi:hypothetical protein